MTKHWGTCTTCAQHTSKRESQHPRRHYEKAYFNLKGLYFVSAMTA